jgi:hypothetical protein
MGLLSGRALANIELYVSPQGDDRWSGALSVPNADKMDGPLATLEGARERLKVLRKETRTDRVTIFVRKGNYRLNRPFVLGPLDGGGADVPVVYQAFPGEVPVITGARPMRRCLPFRNKIFRCDARMFNLASLPPRRYLWGFANSLTPHFDVYLHGERLDLARWPNRDLTDRRGLGRWAHIQGVAGSNAFLFPEGMRLARWTHPGRAQVHIFSRYDWRDQYLDVKVIVPKTRTITLVAPPVDPLTPGQRFYVRNVFEELDAPGEWYFDDAANELFVIPPKSAGDPEVVMAENLVRLEGANNVMLRGFIFEYANGSAIVVSSGQNNVLAKNTIRHTGGFGVEMGGEANAARGNDIYDTGLGGIRLFGGVRATLIPGRNTADNNHISCFGRIIEMNVSPAISVEGVGQRVSHNFIHDGPHMAILVTGNEHLIEFNRIHHVAQDCQDCGAISSYGDWTYRGNIVRHNMIHDIIGYGFKRFEDGQSIYGSPYWFGAAIYIDGAVSGWTIRGNVIFRTAGPQIFINGGRDHVIENNILIDNGSGNDFAPLTIHSLPHESFYQSRNIPNLKKVPYQSSEWQSRYPELYEITKARYTWPEGNVVRFNLSVALPAYKKGFTAYRFWNVPSASNIFLRNFAWNGGLPINLFHQDIDRKIDGLLSLEAWSRESGATKLPSDPLFINVEQDDFRLYSTSSLFAEGFERIPVEKIGLYADKDRVTDPVQSIKKGKVSSHSVRGFVTDPCLPR